MRGMPTDQEIKDTVFSIPNVKMPRLEDLNAFFSKNFWDLIGQEFISAIKSFYSHGWLFRETKYCFITLVPKRRGATTVIEFRPVSCRNVT